jgi:hypothetical protein
MDLHQPPPRGRTVAVAEAVTLAGFFGYVVVPSSLRPLAVAVMVLGALAVVTSAAVWARRPAASRPLAVVAALSSAGLLGAVLYLHSIADEPAAIPLGGVGVLLLSFVGLTTSALLLRAA